MSNSTYFYANVPSIKHSHKDLSEASIIVPNKLSLERSLEHDVPQGSLRRNRSVSYGKVKQRDWHIS